MREWITPQAAGALVTVWLFAMVIAAGVTAGSLWMATARRRMPAWWLRLVRWSLVAVIALAIAETGLHQPVGPAGIRFFVRLASSTAGIIVAALILAAPPPNTSRPGWLCTIAGVATLAVSGVRLQAAAAPDWFDGDPTATSLVERGIDGHSAHALTDRGTTIPLGRFMTIEHEALVPDGFNGRVIVADAHRSPANCHGWVFTGGRFQVASADVGRILDENGYDVVAEPHAGDLIVYRDPDGSIIHTGLVKATGPGGFVLVESKWGPLDIYWHTPLDQVYSQLFEYRRSPRQGHGLSIVEPVVPAGGSGLASGRQPAGAQR